MLAALLAVLGVDLIVIVALVAPVLARKRWVKRQPGAFSGAIRVADGDIDGLRAKWTRGYGRWVRDVLVWTKPPALLRNEILATDGLDGQRPADDHEVKRLGDHPVVTRVRLGCATVEIATREEDRALAVGPHGRPGEASVSNGSPADSPAAVR